MKGNKFSFKINYACLFILSPSMINSNVDGLLFYIGSFDQFSSDEEDDEYLTVSSIDIIYYVNRTTFAAAKSTCGLQIKGPVTRLDLQFTVVRKMSQSLLRANRITNRGPLPNRSRRTEPETLPSTSARQLYSQHQQGVSASLSSGAGEPARAGGNTPRPPRAALTSLLEQQAEFERSKLCSIVLLIKIFLKLNSQS